MREDQMLTCTRGSKGKLRIYVNDRLAVIILMAIFALFWIISKGSKRGPAAGDIIGSPTEIDIEARITTDCMSRTNATLAELFEGLA